MVHRMKIRWLPVALLSAALALAAGCGGGGDDSPFKGSWIAEDGGRITFTNDSWDDSEGDAGSYSFTAGERDAAGLPARDVHRRQHHRVVHAILHRLARHLCQPRH
jgi:hypothetical protein